jgi:hypothetical protein
MSEIIYVARMKEFDKSKGNVRRNTIIMGRSYRAGNATKGQKFVPSNFVEITKGEATELLSKDVAGNWVHCQPGSPHNPIFDVYRVDGEDQLLELIQKEADQRAAAGRTSARAMITGRTLARIITDKPRPALISVEQLEDDPTEPPKHESKVDTAEELTEPKVDPFSDDPTPIEGSEENPLVDDDDEQTSGATVKEKKPSLMKPTAGKDTKQKSTKKTQTKKKKNTGRSAKKQ